jgi:hypothetical protein
MCDVTHSNYIMKIAKKQGDFWDFSEKFAD